MIHDMTVTRAQDGVSIGHVRAHKQQFLASRTIVHGHQYGAHTPSQEFSTVEAAVHWIGQNPCMPDMQLCPNTHGVLGPVLAHWGDITVVLCVHIHPLALATRWIREIGLDCMVLIALDRHGVPLATLSSTPRGWKITLCVETQKITRRRAAWSDAFELFRREVLLSVFEGSAHERLDLLAQSKDLHPLATRMKDQVADLRARPPVVQNLQANVQRTDVWRDIDTVLLGHFQRQGGTVTACRKGMQGQHMTADFTSFAAALAWLDSNPFVPDLERFPFHNGVYGPHLWSRTHRVIGVVRNMHAGMPLVVVQDALDGRGQFVALSAEGTGYSVHVRQDHTGQTTLHDDLSSALYTVCKAFIQAHPAEMLAELLGEMPAARQRIKAFLEQRPQLMQDFLAGKPAGSGPSGLSEFQETP